MKSNKMHTFHINVLIQFLASSTCFEHHVFITRKTFLYMKFCMVRFSWIYASSLAVEGCARYSTVPRTEAQYTLYIIYIYLNYN